MKGHNLSVQCGKSAQKRGPVDNNVLSADVVVIDLAAWTKAVERNNAGAAQP